MLKISVFIITKNEADRIGKIITSAQKIANEIIVIDSGSSDNTQEIANSLGAKVIFNKWCGYGPQKIFGEAQCQNNWILNIDADEEISEQLSDEIIAIFSQKIADDVAGFKIKIVNQFPHEKKPKKYAYFYNQLRLYNKDLAGFKDSTVHDSVMIKPPHKSQDKLKILQLKNIIYHQSFRGFAHWIEKINFYSSMQAQDSFKKNKNPSILKIFSSPILAFFKAFLVRKYFIYGLNGVIYSAIFAFSRFAKHIKTRELFTKNDFEN